MKKIALICLVYFSISNVFSQDQSFIKFGLNLATIASSSIDNYDEFREPAHVGFSFGGGGVVYFTDKIAAHIECTYVEKGVSFSQSSTKNSVLMKYMEFAPSFLYVLSDEYSVMVGLFEGYMMSLLESFEDADGNYTEDDSGYDNVDNKWDFGIQFGTSIAISDNLSIDILYKLGLTNIGDASSVSSDLKHRAINVGFRYALF